MAIVRLRGIAGLTCLGMKFSAAGEAVRISSATGSDGIAHWMLGTSQGSNSTALAEARCFSREQN